MSRITHVELDGFKGIVRRHELGPLTLLSGPNGLGKSAVLEGLRYALSGEVPSGKALDAVAAYFPPRGGAVLVTDAEGNWIRRGITRDHEKAKVSQELEEQGGAEWHANEALLDMRGFLALSPRETAFDCSSNKRIALYCLGLGARGASGQGKGQWDHLGFGNRRFGARATK